VAARCYRCGDVPVDGFARDASKASGYKGLCKPCDREKSRHYYLAHREERLAKAKARACERVERPEVRCRVCGRLFARSRRDRLFCPKRCKDRSRWRKWEG
jgi:hypothetical protein